MRVKTDVQNVKTGSVAVNVWSHDGRRMFHTVDVEAVVDDSNIRFELVMFTSGVTLEEEAIQLRQIAEAFKTGAEKIEAAAAKLFVGGVGEDFDADGCE